MHIYMRMRKRCEPDMCMYFMFEQILPQHPEPLAMVCVAEKGYISLKMTLSLEPG